MKIIAISFIVLLAGCSSFQPSVYSNESTPYGNRVYATGRAATNAAIANTSTNCPSCAVSGNNSSTRHYRDYRQDKSELDRITESATRTLSNEISNSINNAIRDAF